MFTDYIVDRITIESVIIKSFYLKPRNGEPLPSFIPGQYVNVRLNFNSSNKELIRSYTLSDSPDKEHLRLTIKQEPQGISSNYFYSAVAVGDVIAVSAPLGHFLLDSGTSSPVVLLSAGVGITPMLSMIEHLSENQPDREVHFIHSSRNKYVQPALPRLQQIKGKCTRFRLSILHSSPMEEEQPGIDYHLQGRLTKEMIPVHPDASYYVCGPVAYISDVRDYLAQLGIASGQVFFEYFGDSNKPASVSTIDATGESYTITLLKSDKELTWDKSKGTLLELMEGAGLNPSYSCRMGTCSTCESGLVMGTYEYDPEPFMESAADRILICCAVPTSDMEIEL